MGFFRGLIKKNVPSFETDKPAEPLVEPQPREKIDLLPVKSGQRWGFIDLTGHVVIPAYFERVRAFSEGLARIYIDDKGGFIDKAGRLIIEPQFADMFEFTEGLASVKVDDAWRFIDPSGTYVGPEKFEVAYPFREGLALVKIGKKWGYVNSQGAVAIRPDFDVAADFSEGWAAVCVAEKWSFIDKSGTVTLKTEFCLDSSRPRFSEGLALGRIDAGRGFPLAFINRRGEIVSGGWSLASPFSEGFASVSTGTIKYVYGYIAQDGAYAIPPRFSSAEPFSEGLAAVENNERWGFVDRSGRMAIEAKFDYVLDMDVGSVRGFMSGLAKVKIGDRFAYIDKTGGCISFQTLD